MWVRTKTRCDFILRSRNGLVRIHIYKNNNNLMPEISNHKALRMTNKRVFWFLFSFFSFQTNKSKNNKTKMSFLLVLDYFFFLSLVIYYSFYSCGFSHLSSSQLQSYLIILSAWSDQPNYSEGFKNIYRSKFVCGVFIRCATRRMSCI